VCILVITTILLAWEILCHDRRNTLYDNNRAVPKTNSTQSRFQLNMQVVMEIAMFTRVHWVLLSNKNGKVTVIRECASLAGRGTELEANEQ
jgi:hypothetical protein